MKKNIPKSIKFVLLLPVLALAVYAVAILRMKGPINPWVPQPTVQPTTELIVHPDIRFVDVVKLKDQSAALLADSNGRTALLPQRPEDITRLAPQQRLAVSVLSQWQEETTKGMLLSPTRRFKNMKTGEFREFAPSSYPSDSDWVPVEQ